MMGGVKPLSLKRQFIFFSQLTNLYKAGITIAQGLGHLRDQVEDRQLSEIIERLEECMLRRNMPLTDALRTMPGLLPPLILALVEQGEVTGRLDLMFARIVQIVEKRLARMREVLGALAYPAFIGIVAIFLTPIPAAYQAGPGLYVQQVGTTLGGLLAVYLFFRFIGNTIGNTPSIRYRVHKRLLGLPIFGKLLKKVILARFCRAMSIMLASGLSADRAVSIAGRATENDYIALASGAAVDSIRDGNSLAESIRRCNIFPESFSKMLASGEVTGETTNQLDRLADLYDSEADAAIGMMMKALGPMVLMVVAGLIAWQIIGFYMKQWGDLEKLYRSL